MEKGWEISHDAETVNSLVYRLVHCVYDTHACTQGTSNVNVSVCVDSDYIKCCFQLGMLLTSYIMGITLYKYIYI